MRTVLRYTIAIFILAAIGLMAGCASPNTESELPWNTPQQWEGSPMIPGMDRQ